jgi:hypothetical protein
VECRKKKEKKISNMMEYQFIVTNKELALGYQFIGTNKQLALNDENV